MSYAKKKKELAEKGMPNPRVKKNVSSADKKSALPSKNKISFKKWAQEEMEEKEHAA